MKRFNLSEWAIRHQSLVLFMILLLGAAGIYSYLNLGRAEDPSFTIKTMVVHVAWPGATATEMQEQVTDKIEKKLQELPYLDRIESYSQPGASFIRVILTDKTPPSRVKELWYQVRKKVGDIRGDLPPGITGPNFNDEYGDVYSALYMLTADGMSLAELKTRAEDIRQRLLRVADVNKVDIIGERPQKIFIEFSHAKLATLGVTPQQIFDSVAKQNAVVSGGSVDTSADRINVRVTGAFSGAAAIAAVPVQADGQVFRLGDIATVRRGYEDPPSFLVREGGKPALGLGVSMQDGANIITLGENLKRAMNARHRRTAGRDRGHADRGPAAHRRRLGLGIRQDLCRSARHRAGRELPVAGLAHRHRGGAVGAAGARDRAARDVRGGDRPAPHHARRAHHRARPARRRRHHRHRNDGGEDGAGLGPRAGGDLCLDLDRVSDADRHVGHGGRLPAGGLRQIERRRICRRHFLDRRSRADRLVDGRGAVHALSRAQTIARSCQAGTRESPEAIYDTRIYRALRRMIELCLARRKTVVAVTVAMFVAALMGFGLVQQQFFPTSTRSELFFELRLPEGTAIGATDASARRAEHLLADDPDIVTYTTYVGQGSPRFWLGFNPVLPNPNFAQIVIVTKDLEARERVKARLERAMADGALPEARTRVDRFVFGPPVGFPVQFRVIGPDPMKVRAIAEQVRQVMAANPKIVDPHLDWSEQVKSIRLQVDQDRARALGLTPQDVAQTLQTLLSGYTVTQYREGIEHIDVVARAVAAERLELNRLPALTIATRNGVAVPLSQIARLNYEYEEPILWRRNRDIVLTARGDVVDRVQAPDVSKEVEPKLKSIKDALPYGYRIETGGSIEESVKANAALVAVFPVMADRRCWRS